MILFAFPDTRISIEHTTTTLGLLKIDLFPEPLPGFFHYDWSLLRASMLATRGQGQLFPKLGHGVSLKQVQFIWESNYLMYSDIPELGSSDLLGPRDSTSGRQTSLVMAWRRPPCETPSVQCELTMSVRRFIGVLLFVPSSRCPLASIKPLYQSSPSPSLPNPLVPKASNP